MDHSRYVKFIASAFLSTSFLLSLIACTAQPDAALQITCDRHGDINCATKAAENADRQLDAIYERVAHTLEDEAEKHFAIAQRNWFKFRDSYAEFASLRESDAQKSQLLQLNQRIDTTLTRTAELQMLLPKK